jgi:predicted nucleic acid-binding protein
VSQLLARVLRETVTATRKIPRPLDAAAASRIIGYLAHWHVQAPVADDVLAAIDIHRRTGAPFWDAMILRSAKEPGCQTLHSQHLNPGQECEGVRADHRPALARPPGRARAGGR